MEKTLERQLLLEVELLQHFLQLRNRPATRAGGAKPALQNFSLPLKNVLSIVMNYWA